MKNINQKKEILQKLISDIQENKEQHERILSEYKKDLSDIESLLTLC